MPKPRIHLVCNAHLDPVWQWEWEEGAAEAVSTFRVAADLCDEFPAYIFCHNEVILYEWVEEYEPALFERIQRLVAEGKWHIMGGWYLQPDCNMPSGESFVRQVLLGREYFGRRFGARPTTAINLDPFGHTRGLAQILAKSGYDSYLFCRPGQADCPLPDGPFNWIGYDGSEVMATRILHYNSPLYGARAKVEAWAEANPSTPCSLVPWGVGNHGGGPSRRDIEDLGALIAERDDVEILHSTPEAFYAEIAPTRESLPRHEADINPWAVGCYTSQVRLKQKHRELENELYALEKMASSASAQGLMAYPADEIHQALRDLATSQFHDTLPGSSIQAVEDTSLRGLDHGLEIVSRAKARSFFALASGQPKAAEGEIPILVYNPHPYAIDTVVECEFMLADQNWEEAFTNASVYQGECALPSQVEKEASNLNLDWRKRVAFRAELLPSQMNRFDCKLEVLGAKPELPKVSGSTFVHKTDDLEVVINAETGLLDRLVVDGVDALRSGAFEPLVMVDNEDPWGMTVRAFREVEGRFSLMSAEESTKFAGVTDGLIDPVRIIEDGPVRTVVEASFEYGRSAVLLTYRLPKRGTEIEVEVRVLWNEKDRMLKLNVPVSGEGQRFLGQVAYGVEELPSNGDEAVAQKWVAICSGGRALTCINDGIYGSDLSGDGLRLTLLRSAGFCAHPIGDRPIVPQDRFTPRIDQGERLFRFRLNAGPESDRLAKIEREALAANESPMALSFFPSGDGDLPQPLLIADGDAVVIPAVKQAQSGEGLIIRLFEPTGLARSVALQLPWLGKTVDVDLAAFEIKSLKIAGDSVTEVNLIEE